VVCFFARMFLCLFAGGQAQQLPKGLGTEEGVAGRGGQVSYTSTRCALTKRASIKDFPHQSIVLCVMPLLVDFSHNFDYNHYVFVLFRNLLVSISRLLIIGH